MKMRNPALGILRNLLCVLLLLTALGTVLAPQTAYAIDLPWETEFLNPGNYRNWEIRPSTTSVDNENWKVQLNNASCAIPIHLDLSGFIGEHSLYASVELCTTADFEIEFKKANWQSSTVDSDITKNYKLYTMDIFDTSSLNSLIGMIPYVGNIAGVEFKKQIVGAATAPCTVKGKFSVKAVYKVGYDDNEAFDINRLARADYEAYFQITSIDPKDSGRDKDVTVFVGDYETVDSGFGKIQYGWRDWDIIELGPIITGKAGMFAGNVMTWRVEQNQWDAFYAHQPQGERLDMLHTCCESGKPGCITGRSRTIQQRWYEWKSHLRAEILGFEVFDFDQDWGDDEDYIKDAIVPFHQSLTWNEPLEYSAECPHRVYRVPVGVWGNQAKTLPVNGMTVKPAEAVRVDPNVEKYSHDISGTDERGDGLATLYLPYKEGRYTIEASGKGLSGSAEQPSDMVKAKNEQVDIIVQSSETRTLSVRKEWDIDYENKDKPDSIEVLLQAQYYTHGKNIWSRAFKTIKSVSSWEPVQLLTLNEANNWQATFDAVPRWEIVDDSGPVPVIKEIRYRIRELKADSSGAGDVIGEVFEADDNGRILPLDNDEQDFPDVEPYEQDDAIAGVGPNLNEDQARLKKAGKRVVHWRWDLDNTNVYGTIKDRLTNWDQYWQIDTDYQSYLKGLAKSAFFPKPTVTYKVPAYTSSVGERIKEHNTKYVVEYSNEGETTVITNIAVMDVAMYKRWLNFSEDEETPDSVWLILQSRVQEKYLQLAGEAGERMPYTPVFKPLYGNMTNLATLLDGVVPGAGLVGKLDMAGILDIPVAAGKAKKKDNPLISYRLKFGVKKYSMLKLPLDFEAGEVTSELLKDIIKAATGIDLPISISLTGGGYVTFPGKAFNLFKDWELTSNVINIKADLPDGEDDPTIGGMKYWKGEGWKSDEGDGDRLPEYIDIVVHDGDTVIGRVRVNKADQEENAETWAWKLSQSDIDAQKEAGGENTGEGGDAPAPEGGSDSGQSGIQLDPGKTYTITEGFPEDYAHRDSFVATVDGYNITNTWTTSPSLVIEKQFEEGEGEAVTVRLTNDKGETVGDYALNAENGYRVTLKNKKTDAEGGEQGGETDANAVELTGHNISAFKVEEIDAPEQYVPVYSGPAESEGEDGEAVYTFTVTNRVQHNVTARVEKTWEGDRESNRPEGVTVTLKRNGTAVSSATLNATGGWQAEFTEDEAGNPLQALDENGAKYSYTLEEETLEDYSWKVESEESESEGGDVIHTFRLTNTWTGGSDKAGVAGRKIWQDNNDAAQARPESIGIHVMADGRSVEDLNVTEADGWAWRVDGLPRYDEEGGEIRYSVYEDEVEGYTTRYGEPAFDEAERTWTCDVTNAYAADSIDITVNKVWVDAGYDQNRRPESVEVKLYGQVGEARREMASASLTKAGGWTYTFTGLKREERPGQAIAYSVEEIPVPNFNSEVTGSAEEGFTITNTRDDDMYSTRVEKVWDDNQNHDGLRPDSITVHITRDDEIYRTATLSEENGWSHTFDDLKWHRETYSPFQSSTYQYDVTEDAIPGYEQKSRAVSSVGMDYTFTFTNKQKSDVRTGDHKVIKYWEDDDNAPGRRPEQLTVYLMNGEAEARRLTLTAENAGPDGSTWVGYFRNVPLYGDDGVTRIPYTVREEAVGNYTQTRSNTDELADGTMVFELWNEYSPARPKLEVTKVWDDDDSVERPASVTVKLMSGGEVVDTASLTQADGWKYTFEDLDPEQTYAVEEETPAGYEGEVGAMTRTEANGATLWRVAITNRLDRQVRAKYTVAKAWRNADDTPMERWPEGREVTAMLLRAGQEIDRVQLTAGAPEHTFEDLPAYDERGSAIEYSAVEYTVDGFEQLPETLSSQRQADGSIAWRCVFNNRAESETMDIPVTKTWRDEDESGNPSPNRPNQVVIHLLADGSEVEDSPMVVTEGDGWTCTFKGQPIYRDGKKIEYSVTEDRVPYYLSPEISGSAEEGFTVFNEWFYYRRDITVIKQWNDWSAYSYYRPASVTVYLTVNGEVTNYSLEVSGSRQDNTWRGTISGDDLPVNMVFDGIVEVPVAGYRATYSGTPESGRFTVTNTAAAVRYTLKKAWKYADGSDITDTATTVYIGVMRGSEVVERAMLRKSNNYTQQLELPYLDEDGNEIEYTFVEDPVPRTFSVSYDKQADKGFVPGDTLKAAYTVTVTNTQDMTSLLVKKRWDDENNALGQRPESVTVRVKREDGASLPSGITAEATLNEQNHWSFYFRSLPKYDDSNNPIAYTVEEDPVPGYSARIARQSDGSFEIVNSQAMDVRVTKQWGEGGERPESLYVYLYADGVLVKDCRLSGDNGWTHTFEDLQVVNENGERISYTVREEDLKGFRCETSVQEARQTGDGRMEMSIVLTNTPYAPVDVQIPVQKVVEGQPPEAETFTFRLDAYTQNEDQEADRTVTVEGSGSATFDLSFDRKGSYFYTLTEDAGDNPACSYDAATYTLQINVVEGSDGRLQASSRMMRDGAPADAAVFTNRYSDESIVVRGKKIWVDENDRAGKRPSAITIHLLVDGEPAMTRQVTASDGWKWTFEDLPRMSNGRELVYTIQEDEVTDYRTEVNGYNVTNTLVTTPPTPTTDTDVTPTPDTDVTPTPDTDVTPTPEPTTEVAELTVYKVWDETDMPTPPPTPEPTPVPETPQDEAPQDDGETEEDEFEWPSRPDSVTVHVYNGTKHMGEAVLNEANRWRHTFTDLPYLDEGGNVIPYTVTEEFAEGYDTTIGPVELQVDMEGNVYICEVLNTWTGNKTDIPTVTKKVKEKNDGTGLETDWQDAADYDIGDSIPYRLVGTLPTRFAKFEQFTVYTFTDELSPGLTVEADSVRVRKNGEVDLSDRFDILVSGQSLIVRLREGEDMRMWEGEQALTNKDRIIVDYRVTLNGNAVIGAAGNPNAVRLTYTTEFDGEYGEDTTVEDRVIVFTYTIEAHKVDGDGQPLEGAGFTLFKKVDGEWTQIGDEVTGETTFTFRGVDAGEYKLCETTVPKGFNTSPDVLITVIAYYDTEADSPKLNILSVYPTDAGFEASLDEGAVSGDIVNTSGVNLPITGGPGTRGIHAAGAALALAAAALLIRRRRGAR